MVLLFSLKKDWLMSVINTEYIFVKIVDLLHKLICNHKDSLVNYVGMLIIIFHKFIFLMLANYYFKN